MELLKFDAHKKELGGKVTPLMDSTKVNIWYLILLAYYGMEPDSATYYAELCKTLSERIGYKKGIGNYYNGMGLINMVMGRNFSVAEESFKKALKIRTEIGDKVGQAWTYNNMGNMYGGEGNTLESIKSHSQAMKKWEETGDTVGVIESLSKRSRELVNIGNYPDGLKDLFLALKLANEMGYKEGIAIAYRAIGQIYELEGNYSEALKNFIACAKFTEEMGDPNSLENSYETYGKIYLLKGDTAESLKMYMEALKISETNGNNYQIFQHSIDIGNIEYYQGKYDEALKHLLVALRVGESLKEKNATAVGSIAVAKVYNKQGKYQEALIYINKALADGIERGHKDEVKDAYKILSEIYVKLNNFKEAYKYHVLYQQVKDTILNVENTSKMKQLDMQYNFDKDAAIQKAEQDKKDTILAKEVETQKFRRNTIFIVSGIIVIFLIIVIIQRNRIARERRKKELERERNRISRDLHDDLGSGLTKIAMMSQNARKISGDEQQNALQKITNESSDMVEMMNVIIWAMNTHNDSLPNLLSFLKISASEMYEDASINLVWNGPEIIPDIYVFGEIRRNIYLVVKEALHNVLKFSEAAKVTVTITISNDELGITIEDDGKGFEISPSAPFQKRGESNSHGGNGLVNMRKRMEEIKGTFNISSKTGVGTKVSISCTMKDYTKV